MITTRSVPVACAVCRGLGKRRADALVSLPKDLTPSEAARFVEAFLAEFAACEACVGKGWLYVTETITTPDPAPPAPLYPTPQQSGTINPTVWQCSLCKAWLTPGNGVHHCYLSRSDKAA